MKAIHTLILPLLALLCATPHAQAAKASSLEDAYGKAKDNPIMVYCYPANFNEGSEAHYKEFMQRRKLIRGISSLLYVELPVYQNPDKSEAKKQEKALGKVGMPSGMWTLPCILILDKDKNLRGYIRDSATLSNVELCNEQLKAKIDTYKKQQRLLDSAARTQSSRKAKVVAEAADLGEEMGISVPASSAAAAVQADSGNKEGLAARFSFSWETLLPELDKQGNNPGAILTVQNMMKNGKYSNTQQQEILCALTGHLRRNGASAAELKTFYQQMYKLNPKNVYGSYAEECIRTYCAE